MTTATENIIVSVLKTDGTITDEQKKAALRILKGHEQEEQQSPLGKIYTRKEVAAILRKTEACVDWYSRKGWLPKLKFGDQERASGITEEALRAFINRNQTMNHTEEIKQ